MKKLRRAIKNENEKWCPICGEIKNKSEFPRGGSKDGLHSYCKKCTSEMNSKYYKSNKDYFKEYYETIKGLTNRFNATTKSRYSIINQLTEEQVASMLEFFDYKCAYTNVDFNEIRLSFDHIVPISLGGAHEIWNIIPCDLRCNASKVNKDLEKWYKTKDYYSKERLDKIKQWQEYSFFLFGKIA